MTNIDLNDYYSTAEAAIDLESTAEYVRQLAKQEKLLSCKPTPYTVLINKESVKQYKNDRMANK